MECSLRSLDHWNGERKTVQTNLGNLRFQIQIHLCPAFTLKSFDFSDQLSLKYSWRQCKILYLAGMSGTTQSFKDVHIFLITRSFSLWDLKPHFPWPQILSMGSHVLPPPRPLTTQRQDIWWEKALCKEQNVTVHVLELKSHCRNQL